ncbi:MAG: metallophosphoesterase [Myxococcales bacterium]|nr:metallophosphoesterase [Myxococcales bacterium]
MRRNRLALFTVLTVLLSLLAVIHDYFAQRLLRDTALPEPWLELGTTALFVAALTMVAHPVAERSIGPAVGRILGWPAYLWMGTAFFLLLGLSATDLLLWLEGAGGVEVARLRALIVVSLTAVAVLVSVASGVRSPAVKRVELELPGWPQALDGYRVVQLSDIHIGSLIGKRFAERLVERCNALAPDLLAITGDLVDGSVHHLGDQVSPFGRLQARDGVYFCTGNHDHYSGAARWSQRLAELGIQVLRNRRVTVQAAPGRADACFELAGVDDITSRRAGGGGHDLEAALEGWDGKSPLLLLAHNPLSFEHASRRGVHLQLSGHTHGGQIWPFGYLVRLQTRFVGGHYRNGTSQLYVSLGTGYWGPPMRLLAPSEITEVVLRSA